MKSFKLFRTHLSEVARIRWHGTMGASRKMYGNEQIEKTKTQMRRDGKKYHRIANIGDFAVWAKIDDSSRSTVWHTIGSMGSGKDDVMFVDIIHRPSNTFAGKMILQAFKRKKRVHWKVNTIDMNPLFRKSRVGHSIAMDLYKHLNKLGLSVESGDTQTKGGESIWRRLLKDPKMRKQARLVRGDKDNPAAKVSGWKRGDERKVWNPTAKDGESERTGVAFVPKKSAKHGLPPEVETKKHAKQLYKKGTAWKTPRGNWGAKNRQGKVEYFSAQRAAEKWAKA